MSVRSECNRIGLDPDFISHDRAVVQAYKEDPLVHNRVTARLASAILDAGRVVLDAAPTWRVPTLLLYGGDDHFVAPRGSDAFAAAGSLDGGHQDLKDRPAGSS